MALLTYCGWFSCTQNSPGNQSITDCPFQPKVVIFLGDAPGNSNGRIQFGVAVSASKQWVMCSGADAGVNPSNDYLGFKSDACILSPTMSNIAGSISGQAELVSLNSNGFTIHWTTAMSSQNANYMNYIALGGDELQVDVGVLDLPTIAGAVVKSGLAFQPSAVLFGNSLPGTTEGRIEAGALSLGVATSPTQRWALAYAGTDNVSPTVEHSRYHNDKCLMRIAADGTLQAAADLTSFNSDGFSLDLTTAPGAAMRFGYLALGGVSVKAGEFSAANAATQAVSGLGFQPALELFANQSTAAAANTVQDHAKLHVSITDAALTTNDHWAYARNGQTTSDTGGSEEVKAVVTFNSTVTQMAGQATIASQDTDGFTLSWSPQDTQATRVNYLALGTGTGGTGGSGGGGTPASNDGTGTLIFPLFYINLPPNSGSGQLTLPALSANDDWPQIEGDATLPLLQSAGALEPAMPLPALNASAVGIAGAVGTAALSLGLDVSGSGLTGGMGAGAVEWPALAAQGDTPAHGAAMLPAIDADGLGYGGNVGAGAGSIRLTATGYGYVENIGTGAATLPVYRLAGGAAGEGILAPGSGYGELVLATPMASGEGSIGAVMTAHVELPVLALTSEGYGEYVGSAELVLPALTLDAEAATPPATLRGGLTLATESAGLTTWSGPAYNSFATLKGMTLAAGPGGIVMLGGNTDAGAPIDALAAGRLDDFGIPNLKRVVDCFVAYRAAGEMRLTTVLDSGETHDYLLTPRSGPDALHPARTKLGRGAQSRYWQVVLRNVSGADFAVDEVRLIPLPSRRHS